MQQNKFIPIYEPLLGGNESKYLNECINTGWISSKGRFVTEFETSFNSFIGSSHALSASNGTVALHLALEALGIKPGDEIIVPDLTFAASINAILYCGATPVLADIEKETFNMDFSKVEKLITSKTKAIMPVHLYGLACDMDECLSIAKKHNLLVVEDAAEAFGSEFNGQKLGSFGDVATFSFYGNKTITTGEGGMITFKNQEVYQKAKVLRDHGMDPQKTYWHNFIGYNYRMTNMQAAIGLAQIERIDDILKQKIKIAQHYRNRLENVPGVSFVSESEKKLNTYWLVTILVDPDQFGLSRNDLQNKLKENNIDSRPVFFSLHIMPPYKEYHKIDLTNSKYVSNNGISLPSSLNLSTEDLDRICDCIISLHKN
ncbi:DegT/DnrJ/EryC1/StrS family aminotransferase [bacterium SCSIO 12643]|nr:DegT/DnrJ/EryC1/StrS family aminotransferase [bacterium SCSIO 12643]